MILCCIINQILGFETKTVQSPSNNQIIGQIIKMIKWMQLHFLVITSCMQHANMNMNVIHMKESDYAKR